MNRRAFLTHICTGLVGAAVVTRIPVQWLPTRVQTTAALEYLRAHFNNYCEHVMVMRQLEPHRPADMPAAILVSRWLFECAESELVVIRRFAGNHQFPFDTLMFKSVILTYDIAITDPRSVDILDPDQWQRYLAGRMAPYQTPLAIKGYGYRM